jgi:hypothetical protein
MRMAKWSPGSFFERVVAGCDGSAGLLLAIQQIHGQRAYMLAHFRWVCATDWPGFVVLDTGAGLLMGYFAVRTVRRILRVKVNEYPLDGD